MKQGFAGKPRPQELGGAHYAHERQEKEPPRGSSQRPSKDKTKAGGNRQPNGCIKPAPRQGNGASTGAPQTYNGKLDALPAALRPLTQQKNWVVWKWVLKEGASNWTKPPFKAANPKAFAKNNDPSTWSDYATAVAAMKPNGVPFVLTKGMKERLVGKGFSPKQIGNMTPAQAWGHLGNPDVNGIGFMLLGSGIAALDLDKCRNPETGELTPWAQEAVDGALALGAYVEVTVSGTGLRIVGTSDGSRLHKPFPKVDGDSGIELYRDCERYITVSGLEIGSCKALPNIDSLIDHTDELYSQWAAKQKASSSNGGTPPTSKGKIPPLTQERVDNLVAYADSLKSEYQKLNDAAMGAFDKWVPKLFLKAKKTADGGYRVGSKDLGRDREEDLSFHKKGIKDFGVHDTGEDERRNREGARQSTSSWSGNSRSRPKSSARVDKRRSSIRPSLGCAKLWIGRRITSAASD